MASMNDLIQKTKNPGWFAAVLVLGMLVFAFYASTHMVAAGDTWVAMACGRHFDNHGVDTVEPFSFNSHPAGPSDETLEKFPSWSRGFIKTWHPTGWINQNWLTHLIFYKLATWFGHEGQYNYNTLVYWKFVIYFLAVLSVFATGRLLGAGACMSAAAACFAMVVGRTFFDIRPAGYSNLLVPVYIMILALTTYRSYRWVWLIVPVVVFWSNVHGGYLYAFIMLVPFVGIHLLLQLPKKWSLGLGFIGLWAVLYLMSYKFMNHGYHEQVRQALRMSTEHVSLFGDKMLYVWLVLSAISLVLLVLKNLQYGFFLAYHFIAGGIYAIGLLLRFFVETPTRLTPQFKEIYSSMISSSLLAFIFVGILGTLLILALTFKKKRFIALDVRGILHTAIAGVAAFVAMIVFNPFHLTNLTHTFEISISEHAESWRQVNEWKPAFDWMDKTTKIANPVGHEEAFAVLCVIIFAALTVWLIGHFLVPKRSVRNQTDNMQTTGFEWPKIDLATIVIALLTIYMAIKSRRFIAVAGSAAAPVAALLIIQSWHMLTARLSQKNDTPPCPILPAPSVLGIIRISILMVVCGYGVFWGMKYQRIYLDPWPTDNRYHSVFMRMTASHLKPFEVCQFINDNNISGHVFNYWTEGGAVAFGQTPDPQTGHIPLKLFMDGRAQAAYNHDKFRLWQSIFSGGPAVSSARARGNKISGEIIKKSGEWINKQLKKRDVWITLMPQSQENSTFMKALKTTDNWKTAYIDRTQQILVDTGTSQGQALIKSIQEGTAVFPDTISRNLTTATVIMETKYTKRFGDLYALAKSAFDEFPFPSSVHLMARLTSIPQFRDNAIKDLKSTADSFTQNQSTYLNKNGSVLYLGGADMASRYLARLVPEQKKHYQELSAQLKTKSITLNENRIW